MQRALLVDGAHGSLLGLRQGGGRIAQRQGDAQPVIRRVCIGV